MRRSVLSPAARVEQGAVVERLGPVGVVVGAGGVVRHHLDKAARVPPAANIGVDPVWHAHRGLIVGDWLTALGQDQRVRGVV